MYKNKIFVSVSLLIIGLAILMIGWYFYLVPTRFFMESALSSKIVIPPPLIVATPELETELVAKTSAPISSVQKISEDTARKIIESTSAK